MSSEPKIRTAEASPGTPNRPEKHTRPLRPSVRDARSDLEIRDLPLDLIDESDRFRLRHPPYDGIEELADKIRRLGQHTPLFVRPRGERYELISGYRRRAARVLMGSTTAPAVVFEGISDEEAYDLAISENQDRDKLNDLERADICARLIKEGKTPRQVALRMGWTGERNVYNHLRLARTASPAVREALRLRRLKFRVALAIIDARIAELGETEEQKILETVIEQKMSVRQTVVHVARARKALESPERPKSRTPARERKYLRDYEDGGFALTLRVDSETACDLDEASAALRTALKRLQALQQRKAEPPQQPASESTPEAKAAPEATPDAKAAAPGGKP